MPDLEVNMRRTKTGLLIPDHVISNEPGEQLPEKPPEPEKPKPRLIKLNRATRRRLGKPWKGRKMARDKARREASEKAKAGTLPVIKKARKSYGCADDCPCRVHRAPLRPRGGAGA